MTDIEKMVKNGSMEHREDFFKSEASKMWDIKHDGVKVNLPINFYALRQEGLKEKHIERIRKYFTNKNGRFVNNVTYYYKTDGFRTSLFLEESDGIHDWKQNLLAKSVKVRIGGIYRRYHLGFLATALTVFRDLEKKERLSESRTYELCGYSHGAGALPSTYALILHRSKATVLQSIKKFAPPRDIYLPCRAVKKECENHFNFIQGNDIVTKVPWWMKSLGIKIKIRGLDLPWYKKIFSYLFNHDIRGTDMRGKNE
jgi:hypothetical protein